MVLVVAVFTVYSLAWSFFLAGVVGLVPAWWAIGSLSGAATWVLALAWLRERSRRQKVGVEGASS